jgi:hypothetical protein
MTPKTATARLYVSVVSLLAALFEFGAAIVRLAAALALRAAAAVRPRATPAARLPTRPNLRVVPPPSADLERGRLVTALAGMGWPLPRVRAFVDGLGDRVGREPIAALIKEGLADLAA